MRLHTAENMASRIGWSISVKDTERIYGNHKISYVYMVRGNQRIALCPFTTLVMMSKGDFAASLARLPQEVSA